MFYRFLIAAIAVLLVSSCSVSPSYDVYIQNTTDEDLTVSYKSDVHKDGPIQDRTTIKAHERLHLISTTTIKDSPSGRTTAADCSNVADYIDIYNSVGNKSSATWCSEAVQFAVVDVGQGEFTIKIDTDSF